MTVPRCGSKKKQGPGTCKKVAGWGTDHVGFGRCKLHGGASANGRVAAQREQAAAEAVRLGVAIETDPHEALAMVVNILSGQVGFLQKKVAEIEEGTELDGPALHPTVRALGGILDQLRQAGKAAADAGVAKRRADLDELLIAGLADAVRRAISDVPSITNAQGDELLAAISHHVKVLDETDDWGAPRVLTA